MGNGEVSNEEQFWPSSLLMRGSPVGSGQVAASAQVDQQSGSSFLTKAAGPMASSQESHCRGHLKGHALSLLNVLSDT